jgi:hypothetical protein
MLHKAFRIAALGIGAAVLGPSSYAEEVQPTKEACADAFARAQQLRAQNKLLEARGRVIFCGQSACPALVRKECLQILPDFESMIPSIVFGVRTSDGKDVANADLSVDGVRHAIDGKPITLDPGAHRVECDASGFAHYQDTVVASAGERNRLVSVSLKPLVDAAAMTLAATTKPAPKDPGVAGAEVPPHGFPVVTYVLAGVGIAALGSTAYFGATGLGDAHHMRDTCKPDCLQEDVDAAHSKILIANISFGVGVVALGASLWTALASKSPPRTGALGADLVPTEGGASMKIWSRF